MIVQQLTSATHEWQWSLIRTVWRHAVTQLVRIQCIAAVLQCASTYSLLAFEQLRGKCAQTRYV
jgi:hypothetical protein